MQIWWFDGIWLNKHWETNRLIFFLKWHLTAKDIQMGYSDIMSYPTLNSHAFSLFYYMKMTDLTQFKLWRTCFKQKQYILWSGQNNLFEHDWDTCRRCIGFRPMPQSTVWDLEIILPEEWNWSLIASIENKCGTVVTVRGDSTSY